MKNWLKQRVRSALHRRGMYVVHAMTPPNLREACVIRRQWLSDLGVTLVIDAGANVGQFAQSVRAAGYRGRILSFEPQKSAFDQLRAAAAADPHWKTFQLGLGEAPVRGAINVAANSQSSSLLPMLDRHRTAASESAYIATEEIDIITLDSLQPETISPSDVIWLKLDVQGFELAVLRGATAILRQTVAIECELSLVSLYQGGPLIEDVIAALSQRGFRPASFEQGFTDQATQRMMQIDGVFLREKP